MNALLREDTPYSLRIVIALTVLVFAITSWLIIVNALTAISFTTATLGVVVLMTAFLALGVLRTQRFPFVPLWVTLGSGIIWSSLMMLSLSDSPRWDSFVILSAIILLSAAGGFFANRKPRVSLALLLPLALFGLYGLVVVPIAVWNGGGPAIKGTGAPVTILGAACFAALWHALSVRKHTRITDRSAAL